MKAKELSMYEQLVLMALRDEEGTLESKAGMHQYALGGAILAELVLADRLAIDDSKKHLVHVTRHKRVGEPLLDEALQMVADSKREKRAEHWVARFASIKNLRHRVAQQLCRRGVLKESEDKILWIFTRKIYPEIDPEPERELVQQLHDAIFRNDKIPPQTAIVLSLANATGMLRIHFDKKELKRRKERIEQITSGSAIGEATRATVQAVQAAMIAAQTAATMAAVSAAVNT